MKNDAIYKAVEKMVEFLPEDIEIIKSIIEDKSVEAKTRIYASRTLLSAEKRLRQIVKEKGGETLSPKENTNRG